MEFGLKGKKAFISGGTRGIGRAIAHALAAEGTALYLTARDEAMLAQTAQELTNQYGVACRWSAGDYQEVADVERIAVEALAAFDGFDILVNNAGRSNPTTLESPPAEWLRYYQLNFVSHLMITRHLLPSMKANGWGRIINIAGVSGKQPEKLNMGMPPKLGLYGSAKSLARELAPHGITVNVVGVGKIESHQIGQLYFTSAAARTEFAQANIPLGRFGQPHEVAAAVAFLASEKSSYITGSVLSVDGGITTSLF